MSSMKGDIWQLQAGATRYELEEIRIQQVPSEAFWARIDSHLVGACVNSMLFCSLTMITWIFVSLRIGFFTGGLGGAVSLGEKESQRQNTVQRNCKSDT